MVVSSILQHVRHGKDHLETIDAWIIYYSQDRPNPPCFSLPWVEWWKSITKSTASFIATLNPTSFANDSYQRTSMSHEIIKCELHFQNAGQTCFNDDTLLILCRWLLVFHSCINCQWSARSLAVVPEGSEKLLLECCNSTDIWHLPFRIMWCKHVTLKSVLWPE